MQEVVCGADDDCSEEDLEHEENIDDSSDDCAALLTKHSLGEDVCGQTLTPNVLRRGSHWLPACFAPGMQKRRIKGICPLCDCPVGKGAHVCKQVEGRVFECKRSEALRRDGNVHFRAGRYEEALKVYSSALERTPDDAKLWRNRAATHTALRQLGKALADSNEAIQLAPSWSRGYFTKALIFERREEWGAASDVYREVLQRCYKSEDKVRAQRFLSICRRRQILEDRVKQLPVAFNAEAAEARRQTMLKNGAEMLPEVDWQDEERSRLEEATRCKADGNAAVSQQDWDAARRRYDCGVEQLFFCSPYTCDEHLRLLSALRLNQALCASHVGNHEEVVQLCGDVIQLDPSNVKARFRRATALGELEDYDLALDDLSILSVLQPDTHVRALQIRLRGKRKALLRKQRAQCARMFASDNTK
eukprot:TRINITY_DN17011_c0_g1_i1.p1 TRINITY_DN17011_c0_g1~~TRINITY_DN17011_c0_g1_i1.p1  ORF type:complete len:419 (-),score=104.30 TRINITY_DN17011_c0_g1_i1:109-1365(-)